MSTNNLTPKQQQVIDTFNRCNGNKRETARQLHISRSTLNDHLEAIWRKLETRPSQEQRGYLDDMPPGGC